MTHTEIEDVLRRRGFVRQHAIQKTVRYWSNDLQMYVYLNRTAGEANSVLIVHPNLLPLRESLLGIAGVHSDQELYHNSNMGEFPKRRNRGKRPIHYGLPFGFRNMRAVNAFLDALLGSPAGNADAIGDIEAAREDFATLPETERQAIIKSRIGQGRFRDLLVRYWGACAVTGCSVLPILKASHMKPWRASNNKERLDVFNGLLLLPNLDAAFDQGFISFENDGCIIIAPALDRAARIALGIDSKLQLTKVDTRHHAYLAYHRSTVLRKA